MSAFSLAVSAILKEEAARVVGALGIETDAELACYFRDEMDLFEVSAKPDVVSTVTHAWRVARLQVDIALQKPVKRARVVLEQRVPQAGAGLRPKARCVPPVSLLPRPFRAQYASKPLRSQPAMPDAKSALLQTVMELVITSASENTQFDRAIWDNPAENFVLFAARFRTVSEEQLRAHLRAFRRWVRWHGANVPTEVLYWKPTALWMAKYLAHVAQGGPTASCQAFASLKWWATVVGLPLPMSDGMSSIQFSQRPRCSSPSFGLFSEQFARPLVQLPHS